MAILTGTDKADIRSRVSEYVLPDQEIAAAEREVGWFAETTPHVVWAGRMLEDLVEGVFRPNVTGNSRTGLPVKTMTDLRVAWSAAVQARWNDHVEELEDASYRMTCGDVLEHPWTNELIALGNWWLLQTPYVVWQLSQDMERAATSAMRDSLYWLIWGQQGEMIAHATKAEWDRQVKRMTKRFERWQAERKEAA